MLSKSHTVELAIVINSFLLFFSFHLNFNGKKHPKMISRDAITKFAERKINKDITQGRH